MGGIKAVIFDWSGTVVDFGSRAPVEAFIETVADLPQTIDDIAGGLAAGRMPFEDRENG